MGGWPCFDWGGMRLEMRLENEEVTSNWLSGFQNCLSFVSSVFVLIVVMTEMMMIVMRTA